MGERLDLSEWSRVVDTELLGLLVSEGGSAVRFIVADASELRGQVRSGLTRLAEARGMTVAHLDAAEVKLQAPEQWLFALGGRLDLGALAHRQLFALAREKGLPVPPSLDAPNGVVDAVAQASALSQEQVTLELRRAIDQALARPAYGRDLRAALRGLLTARLRAPDPSDLTLETVRSWLDGSARSLANLRRLGVSARIHRHNARHHLAGLTAWLRDAGVPGAVVVADLSQALADRPPQGVRYTRAARLDLYEVLREHVDGAEANTGLLLAVVAPAALVDDDLVGVRCYSALHMRLHQDFTNLGRPNPLGSLVRVWP